MAGLPDALTVEWMDSVRAIARGRWTETIISALWFFSADKSMEAVTVLQPCGLCCPTIGRLLYLGQSTTPGLRKEKDQ
jgi:hypothetical protein